MAETSDVTITTVTSILIIASIVGNSLVCAVIKRNRDMRTSINYLLVNLAVADIIYSTFLIPELIFSHMFTDLEGFTGKVVCMLRKGMLSWIGGNSSLVTLVAIAVERYYAVIYPLRNKGTLTTGKLKIIIPCSWIFSSIINLPDYFALDKFVKEINPNYCNYKWPKLWMKKAYVSTWNAFVVLSFMLMAGLYSRVVYTLWFKHNDVFELTYQQQGALKVRKRVTLMLVTITAIFVICWGTDLILHVLEDVGSYKLNPFAIPTAHTMVMFNSAVNPFTYALINQRFREKMKAMMCCSSSGSAPGVHAEREPQDIEMA